MTTEWRELDWRFLNAMQCNRSTLHHVLAEASKRGKEPCRLVVGETARAHLNDWYGHATVVEDDWLHMPILEGFRILREGSRDIILEIVVGDFVDDGRWYIEDHDGFRLGSIGW